MLHLTRLTQDNVVEVDLLLFFTSAIWQVVNTRCNYSEVCHYLLKPWNSCALRNRKRIGYQHLLRSVTGVWVGSKNDQIKLIKVIIELPHRSL